MRGIGDGRCEGAQARSEQGTQLLGHCLHLAARQSGTNTGAALATLAPTPPHPTPPHPPPPHPTPPHPTPPHPTPPTCSSSRDAVRGGAPLVLPHGPVSAGGAPAAPPAPRCMKSARLCTRARCSRPNAAASNARPASNWRAPAAALGKGWHAARGVRGAVGCGARMACCCGRGEPGTLCGAHPLSPYAPAPLVSMAQEGAAGPIPLSPATNPPLQQRQRVKPAVARLCRRRCVRSGTVGAAWAGEHLPRPSDHSLYEYPAPPGGGSTLAAPDNAASRAVAAWGHGGAASLAIETCGGAAAALRHADGAGARAGRAAGRGAAPGGGAADGCGLACRADRQNRSLQQRHARVGLSVARARCAQLPAARLELFLEALCAGAGSGGQHGAGRLGPAGRDEQSHRKGRHPTAVRQGERRGPARGRRRNTLHRRRRPTYRGRERRAVCPMRGGLLGRAGRLHTKAGRQPAGAVVSVLRAHRSPRQVKLWARAPSSGFQWFVVHCLCGRATWPRS
jgi:hypothetical protein